MARLEQVERGLTAGVDAGGKPDVVGGPRVACTK